MTETTTTLGHLLPEQASTRERILNAAYDLFSRHGLRAVGINSVVEHSGVAKRTLYRHFASKDELIVEFLRMREERWTKEWLLREVEERAVDPQEQLLAVFDVLHEWFQGEELEGCAFMNVVLEVDDRSSPVRRAAVEHLATIRRFLEERATQAGIERADDFARRWGILVKGSIVSAQEGDSEAARRAHAVGRLLLEREIVRKTEIR